MQVVTVSDKGQVVIPAKIRHKLGIVPGCQLTFSLEGDVIQVQIKRSITPTKVKDGYGLLKYPKPEEHRLSEFDEAKAMQEQRNDRD